MCQGSLNHSQPHFSNPCCAVEKMGGKAETVSDQLVAGVTSFWYQPLGFQRLGKLQPKWGLPVFKEEVHCIHGRFTRPPQECCHSCGWGESPTFRSGSLSASSWPQQSVPSHKATRTIFTHSSSGVFVIKVLKTGAGLEPFLRSWKHYHYVYPEAAVRGLSVNLRRSVQGLSSGNLKVM